MCRSPVFRRSPVRRQGDVEGDAAGAHFSHERGDTFPGLFGHSLGRFQEQFVMHLKDQARVQLAQEGIGMDGEHGQLDDIRGASLNQRVERLTPGQGLSLRVFGVQIGQKATAAGQRRHMALLERLAFHVFVELPDPLQAFKVALHEGFGFGQRDVQFARQLLRPHTVDQAEIDRFCVAALIGGNLFDVHIIQQAGGAGVDVLPPAEGGKQRFIM